MKHYISMSSTLTAWLGGTIKLEDLQAADAKFYFGCSWEHLRGSHGVAGVPHEATWSNTELPKVYGPEDMVDAQRAIVSIEQVDKSLQNKVRQFIDLVAAADAEDRVHWQVGNYPALLRKLAEEVSLYETRPGSAKFDDVWAFGRWTTLGAERKSLSNY